MSSSTGKGLEQGGVWVVGGVEGGEGNRVGWMGGGSRPVGGDGGKNTNGWMGETGEGEDGLLRELGGMGLWSGLDGDDGGDVPSVNTAGKSGGVGVSRDTQGAAGGVFILEWDVELAGAGGKNPTLLGGGAEEAADAAAGLCSLVGEFVGEAVGAGGAARPADPICGP